MPAQLIHKVQTYGKMIKFSHTIFALPFALSAVVMAWRDHSFRIWDLLWILAAMVGARSAAMGFNRIVDARLDARNPRTANREIPSGKLSSGSATRFVWASSALFIVSAFMLGPLCFALSFPVLLFLLAYSYTKRFTALCHLFLGFAISLAPLGAWVAVTDSLGLPPLFLTLALMFYIAGFDILYACQDIEFDRNAGLHSLPSAIGPAHAMTLARFLHLLTLICLLALFFSFEMHPVFLIFLAVIALLLFIEHRLVSPRDLSRIHVAFFHINSMVSMVLFIGVISEALVA